MADQEKVIDLNKENKKLTRKVKLLEQSLEQFKSIKDKYDGLIVKLNEKDEKLKEINEDLEIKIFERTLELQTYIDVINNVAFVLEFDNECNIIECNDNFLNRIDYEKEKLLELNLDDILAGSRSKIFLKELMESLSNKEIVTYENKFISQGSKNEFFVKNTYFKMDEELERNIAIGFSITSETLEKKEFNKKVVEKIREFNQKEFQNKKIIANLNLKISEYESYLQKIQSDNEDLKIKIVGKSKQIQNLEEQLSKIDNKYLNIISLKNKDNESYIKTMHNLKEENEDLKEENEDLKRMINKLNKM